MCLKDEQRDALTELVNIGVGRAAASLSDLTGERVELSIPRVMLCDLERLNDLVQVEGEPFDTLVFQDFTGELSGRAVLAFPRASGMKLGKLLGNLDSLPNEMDLDLSGILMEVGNIVLNGVLGSMANMTGTKLSCAVTELLTGQDMPAALADRTSTEAPDGRSVLLARVRFHVATRDISGSIALLFEFGGVESLLQALFAEQARE